MLKNPAKGGTPARASMPTMSSGFIGSALVRRLLSETDHELLNLDKLTYAGSAARLGTVEAERRCTFVRADICDAAAVAAAMHDFQPDRIVHLAAESHVDRSIDDPAPFVATNVVGTFTLLQEALRYWRGLSSVRSAAFRFHHVSTDEVFGSLPPTGRFDEASAYDPRSPYSATKAASDHLVRAWRHSYGLPTLVTNSVLLPAAVTACL